MNLNESILQLAGKRVLIASDFDGTLAELVDRHEDVEANPKAVGALSDLAAKPEVTVAVVSGRSRDDLLNMLGHPDGWVVIGEHGGDTGAGEPADQDSVEAVSQRMQAIAAVNPGTRVETKRMSVVFHYRTAEGNVATALQQVRATAGPGMGVSEGKKVVEVHVSTTNKGEAVASLREKVNAEAVVFLGDDLTDETVFSTLLTDDVGVKVGEGETAARFRVEDVREVAGLLEYLTRVLT